MVAAHYDDARVADHIRAMIPMGRLGEPADIATLVAFLASPAAEFISGQTISPNGAAFVGAM
jgi:NAD(P)-dependent dehydrogenase (short-subunit alcohol dehydrogenase family)